MAFQRSFNLAFLILTVGVCVAISLLMNNLGYVGGLSLYSASLSQIQHKHSGGGLTIVTAFINLRHCRGGYASR